VLKLTITAQNAEDAMPEGIGPPTTIFAATPPTGTVVDAMVLDVVLKLVVLLVVLTLVVVTEVVFSAFAATTTLATMVVVDEDVVEDVVLEEVVVVLELEVELVIIWLIVLIVFIVFCALITPLLTAASTRSAAMNMDKYCRLSRIKPTPLAIAICGFAFPVQASQAACL
jgi:hypothetical protein